MTEVLTKALSKENLAYYDTNVRPQQVKDVEVEGSQLKITKRDGSTNNLDLPGGGSFKYNTDKRYTTIYLTEDALKTLGYTGFEDSSTVLKYRAQVGTVSTFVSDSPIYGTPSTTKKSYRAKFESSNDYSGGNREDSYWNDAVRFGVSNPYTRVNVLERKTVNYLPDLSETFIMSNKFQEIAAENDFNTKYIDSASYYRYMVGVIVLFDSEGHQKAYFKTSTSNYPNYLAGDGFSNIIDAWIYDVKKGYPGISYLNDNIIDNFAEGDTVLFTVYTDSQSDWGSRNSPLNDDNIEEWKTNIKNSYADAMTFELYTYEDFQDIVVPIEAEVLPIQVPAKYEEYTNTFLTSERPTPTTFNLYAFAVNFLGVGEHDAVRIVGQNIGNGIIVGNEFKYISNVEGDDECGVTTFTEVYPE